ASATHDAATGGFGTNEGDNEITGVHVSNGNAGPEGLLGAQIPNLWNSSGKWRWFYTQQHGDNFTWQVVLASHNDEHENGDWPYARPAPAHVAGAGWRCDG